MISVQKRNLELKAALASIRETRRQLRRIGAKALRRVRQVDTYYRLDAGRLKLRKTVGGGAQLVYYERLDQPRPKQSDVILMPVGQPAVLGKMLSKILSVTCVVQKSREVYDYRGVQIHLDTVKGLGEFTEFEKVLGHGRRDLTEERNALLRLLELLGVERSALLSGSYCDLLLATTQDQGRSK